MKNKGRILAGILSLTLVGSLAMPAAAVRAENLGEEETKDYLVVLREGTYSAAQFSAECEGTSENAAVLADRNYLVLSMTEEEAAQLMQDDRVLSVEEDIIVTAMSENDDTDVLVTLEDLTQPEGERSYEWNLTAIHATPEDLEAYQINESVVRVAVLDSGISVCDDLDVVEYINLVTDEQEIITYDQDGTGHGTAVAGLLAAKDDDVNEGIIGVAPDVTLYSVKVFDYSNSAPISRIIEGIYWAIDNDIHIINMSFGTTVNSYALHQAVQEADAAGILMVAAAGNGSTVEYPAAYPEVIGVGATDYEGNRAVFSATGAMLELMAPGECVLTDSFYGGVMALSGTSLAAPQVAGAAALLWAKDMTKSSDFIRQLLNTSANRSLGTTEEYGNGLLDVQRAFEIYDEFEQSYVPGESEYEGIEENTDTYVIGDNPGYVVGLWGSTQHNASINQGSSISSNVYTSTYLELMRTTSWFLDSNDLFRSSWDQCYFHGGRNYGSSSSRSTNNYVNDLIFLYNVAVALKEMSGKSLALQQAKVDEIAASMMASNSVTINATFINKVKSLLGVSVGTVSGISNQTTATVNSYKILGAALHLAGDIYAHRSIVPRNSVENTVTEDESNAITGNYYNLNHFGSGTACSLSKIEEKAYNAFTTRTGYNTATEMCQGEGWECFKLGVENGMMEFKDIWRWTTVDKSATFYEDNVNFYKSRYSVGTTYTTQVILSSYVNGTALDAKLFLPGVYSGKSYAIRLNALKLLYAELGFSWDDSWSAYTTTIVR